MRFNTYLTLIVLLYGCNHNSNNDNAIENGHTIIEVNPNEIETIYNSDFINNFSFLKLSSNDKIFLGGIDKMIEYNDEYYILDSEQAKGVFVFDNKGELKYAINKEGRGPGEITAPYDFDIDKENKELIIFDAAALKLVFFNLNDGSYINEKILNVRPDRFALFNNKFIFFMNNSANEKNSKLIVRDRDLNIIEDFLEIDSRLLNYTVNLPLNFSTHNSKLYITIPSDYNIYYFDNGNDLNVGYSIDPNDFSLPESYFSNGLASMERFNKAYKSVAFISNFLKTDSYYFFTYRHRRNNGYFYSSTLTDKVIHTNNQNIVDDLGIGPISRWPVANKGDTLIWYQQSHDLLEYIEQKKNTLDEDAWREFVNKNSELMTFSQSITKTDNPYLIFTEIKL
jgi:hypothetical protein